jgi:hypothetical protein
MINLKALFDARDVGTVSAQDTYAVDIGLSAASSSDIPDDQVQNVCDYINSQLLHNYHGVSVEHRAALEALLQDLVSRR